MVRLTLNNKFYRIEDVKAAISDFKEVCTARILSNAIINTKKIPIAKNLLCPLISHPVFSGIIKINLKVKVSSPPSKRITQNL